MGLDGNLIDELLAGRLMVAEITGKYGLLKQLTKAILERRYYCYAKKFHFRVAFSARSPR